MTPPQNCGWQFHLDPEDVSGLLDYLRRREFVDADGGLTVEKAGDGNMNCVLRVRLPKRSFILKQAPALGGEVSFHRRARGACGL